MSVSFWNSVPEQRAHTAPSGLSCSRGSCHQASTPPCSMAAAALSKISGRASGSPHSMQRSTVMGVPQDRWREMHQSGTPGDHGVDAVAALGGHPGGAVHALQAQLPQGLALPGSSSSMVMNHCSVARKKMGVLVRQQWG